MIEVKCPDGTIPTGDTVFLAGGISNCPDWQENILKLFADTDLILFNPRRKNYDYDDPNVEQDQIEWEYLRLDIVKAALFWFPCETQCSITLYELGKLSERKDMPIFIGTHPEYTRTSDVTIQTKLIRPEVEIAHSLEELAAQVKSFFG